MVKQVEKLKLAKRDNTPSTALIFPPGKLSIFFSLNWLNTLYSQGKKPYTDRDKVDHEEGVSVAHVSRIRLAKMIFYLVCKARVQSPQRSEI